MLPSRREGYGLVVVEACAAGTPSVVVADPDNAATELIEEGVNGFVARVGVAAGPRRGDPARARGRPGAAGVDRRLVRRANARRLSLADSLERVAAAYADRS